MPPVYTVRLFEVQERPHRKAAQVKKLVVKKRVSAAKKRRPSRPKSVSKPRPKKRSAKAPKHPKKVKRSAVKRAKKVVSLRPKSKKRVKKALKARKAVAKKGPKRRSEDLAGLESMLKKRLAALKERVEMERAEERLSRRLAELAARKREAGGASPARGQGRATSQVLRLYLARVYETIRSHWILPESLLSQGGLEAVVVIRVMPNGSIAKRWFERRSGLALFDNSVMRAVDEAAPLPPMPKALGGGPLEIGVRFRPGDVGIS